MSDEALKAKIEGDKAQREKYRNARRQISYHSLDTKQSLTQIEDWIKECEDTIEKIDGNDGYFYLSELREKLAKDIKTMQEYHDFVRDANTSYVNLYNTLGDKIETLSAQISRDVDTYNADKFIFDRIYFK